MLKKILIGVALLLIHTGGAWAASCAVTNGSGNWSTRTWSCGVPAAGDTIFIGTTTGCAAGVTVTMDTSPTHARLTVCTGSVLQSDNTAGRTLTISGAAGTDLQNDGTITFDTSNPATITLSGAAAFGGAGSWQLGAINVNSRALTFANAMTLSLSAATPISITSGSISNAVLVTWIFDGSVAQTLPSSASALYGKIRINNTATGGAGVTLGVALTTLNLIDNLEVLGGILKDGGFRITGTAGKTFQIATGATFQFTNANALSGFGTFDFGTASTCGTFEYALAGAQTVTAYASNYGNLKLSGSGVKTIGSAMTLGCDFIMAGTASTNNPIGGALTVGRDMTLGSGTTFIAGALTHNVGRNFSNNGATFTAGTSTLNFNGSAAQVIGPVAGTSTTFNSVTISNTSGGVSLGVDETVGGTLTLTSGTLSVGANTLSLNGPAIAGAGANSNLSTTSSSSLSFGGASASVFIPSNLANLNNLTINNTNGVTENSNLTLAGTLTLTNGALSVGANTLALNGPAISQTSGTLTTTSSSNLSFGGSASGHFIPSSVAALNNLTVNNSNGVAESSSVTLSGTLALTSGALSVGANTLTLNGPAISQTSGSLTTTSSSNLIFGGSSSSHFIPSSVTALNNLTINNANGVAENSGITLSGTLTLTSGALAVGANTLALNGPAITQTSGSLSTTSSSNLSFGGASSSHFIPSSVTALNNLTINNANGVAENSSVTVSGTLTLTNGALAVGANTLTLNGPAISQTSGSLTTTSSSNLAFGGSASSHFIPSSVTALNNLMVNNSNGVTESSSITMSGTLTLSSGALSVGANTLTLNGPAISQTSGSLTTTSSSNLAFGGASASHFVPSSVTALNNLTINNANGVTQSSNITLSGTLTLTNGALSVGANTLALNGPAISQTSGSLTTTSSSNLSIGGSSSSHFIPSSVANLNNFTLNNTNGVTQSGNLTLAGSATITAGTLDTTASNRSLSVSGSITGAGTLKANGSAVSVGGDMTVTTFTAGTSTVTYNGSGAQAAGGAYTYNNLVINKSAGSATLGGNTTVGGNLTITAGTLDTSGSNRSLSVTGNITGAGSLAANGSAISVAGDMTVTTLTAGTSTVTYNGGGAQAAGGTYTYNNLVINKSGGSATLGGNTAVGGNLTITAGTLDTSGSNRSLSVTGNITGAGTLTANGSAISVGGDMTPTTFTAGTSTVTYNGGGAQAAGGAYTYNNLVINKSGGSATLGGNTTVGSNLTITAGTLDTSGSNRSLTVTGNITGAGTLTANGSAIGVGGNMTVTTFTAGTSTVTYNGSGAQTAGGTYSYRNLTINKSSGAVNLGGDATISGTLTFAAGNSVVITGGANTVIITSSGSVTRTGTGHVNGKLQMNVPTGNPSRAFEIGDATVYAPVTISFSGPSGVTTAGNLTLQTVGAEHPDIANSGIDSTQDVTRYWAATNTGIVFDTYDATFKYVAGDVDGGVDLTTFGVAKGACDASHLNCAWRYPTFGSITSTTAPATGMTSFSDFGVGRRVAQLLIFPAGGATTDPIPNQDADTNFNVTIRAVDSAGNTVTNFNGTASLTCNVGCTLTGGGTVTLSSGQVTVNNLKISTTGTNTLTATLTSNVDATGSKNVTVFRVSSFNVIESSQAASTGKIFTRIAGTNFNVDNAGNPLVLHVAALDNTGTVITTFFPRTVSVEVVDNTTGGGVCANMTQIAAFTSENFVSGDLGRHALTTGSSIANVYRNAKFRITYTAVTPNVTACSTDNFAIRPASLVYSITDGSPTTAGTTNTLNNKSTSLATVHKAGRPFTITATAKNSANATTTLYNPSSYGGPTAVLGNCAGGDACAAFGAVTTVSWSASNGVATSNDASYNEVGAFTVNLQDSGFASVDNGDGTSDAQRIVNYTAAAIDVGRFIPDHFSVSYSTPQFTTACTSATGFTYVGQAFNYGVGATPVITVTAQTFSGTTTANYSGATLARITNSTLTGRAYTAASGTLDTSGLPSTATDPTVSTFTNGVGTLTFSSGSGLAFTRTTPAAPFNADISLAINIIDADGVTFESPAGTNANPARFSAASAGNGIAFSGGKTMRFGRLRLLPATGTANVRLPVTIRTEYWNGSGFIKNGDDSCTTLSQANIALGTYAKNLNACETRAFNGGAGAPPQTISFASGTGTLYLAAPGVTNTGSVVLTTDLGSSSSGNYCLAVGGTGGNNPATTPASKSYLQGAWNGSASYDRDPAARYSFGVYGSQPNQVIFLRENY